MSTAHTEQEEPWHVRRKRELEAGAPAKRKKVQPFAKVPLPWFEAAARATRSPRALILVELLYASWKAGGPTFPLPNGRLVKLGASREIKRKVLRDLERAGLLSIERPPRKTPVVTLISS